MIHTRFLAIAVCATLLTACGGGDGGTTPTVAVTAAPPGGAPSPPTPTSTPVPILPPFANTTNQTYMPLALGNRWVFSSGGAMTDMGPGTISCACAINRLSVETVDLTTPSGAYSGSFYYRKNIPAGMTGVQTLLVGSSANHGALITFLTNGTIYGLFVMDDNATLGEVQAFSNETSTITAINQLQTYVNGQSINFVNTDVLSGALSLSWNYAKGVGLTSLTLDGQTITLVSFSINVAGSQGIGRMSQSIRAEAVPMDANTVNPAAGLFR